MFAPQTEVRPTSKKCLTQRDETCHVKNEIGGETVQLEAIEMKETPNKRVNWKP